MRLPLKVGLEGCLLSGPYVEGENGVTIGTICKELDCGSQDVDPITSIQISADDPRGVQISNHLYSPSDSPFTRKVNQVVIDVVKSSSSTTQYEAISEKDGEEATDRDSTMTESGKYNITLRVASNWTRIRTKDALIFLPGFNSW